jgi:RNA polymerase sigma-70 factor, ECF subfamily
MMITAEAPRAPRPSRARFGPVAYASRDGAPAAKPQGRAVKGGDESLESVMARYVAGDPRAFDQLYGRVAPRVLGYLRSMARDRVRADDLCQTTFLKLHRGRAGWLPNSPVIPWVMAIARNAFYDDALQRKRARVRLTATGEVPDLIDLELLAEAPDTDRPSAELHERVARAVDALPTLQREALALTTKGGLTHRDAAAALDTTTTAIKLRVHRAYEALRAALHAQPRGR